MRLSRQLITCAGFMVAFGVASSVSAQGHFIRGDSNLDKKVDLTDGVFTLGYLFLGTTAPPCLDGADSNDSGVIDIADAIYILNFLFSGGPAPAEPFAHFEADPTPDSLGCLGPNGAVTNVTGAITSDTTWTSGNVYRLQSGVFVKDGATLNIEAGVTVLGESSSDGLLVIERGGKLNAVGTATHPVVFTTDQPAGNRQRGDWGGLIFLGRGEINVPGGEGLAEGLENQFYGGGATPDNAESSGRLSYVRVEFGGTPISPDNEVNSISLFGIGSGTQLDHIQCKFNDDDGIEWFGGAASVKYGLVTCVTDDMFDYSFGWRGMGQFWVGQEKGDSADTGFEVDNSEAAGSFANTPITSPTISNVTLVGTGDPSSVGGGVGILIRRGAGTKLYNFLVQGFKKQGFDVDDAITCDNVDAGRLIIDYGVWYDNGADGNSHWMTGETDAQDESTFTCNSQQFVEGPNSIIATSAPVVDGHNLTNPDFRPQGDALTNPKDMTSVDSFFEPAPYRGGVPPTGDDWTQATWVSYAQN